ncbi:ABC transporter ATP-binding protein [uncultured Ferrimonas sp.]|uniref:ABC transporter ATP-binding protein n=1 Tax=uncultured Ferrimonas sp. TaxID=432640 RepID=UPI002620516D|nr:ABC transporter ATP-binding protein [uncultured Ferrimonas sp.]
MLQLVPPITADDSPAISVAELSWACPEKLVLAQISFAVQRGEFVGLLGPNGAGKSTLLRCLYRYLKPSSGSIYIGSQALSVLSQRQLAQRIAVVTQHSPVGFAMTVRQFMATGLLAHQRFWQRSNDRGEQQQIDALLARVELSHLAEQRYDHLSGGEQQRLLIARAMLQRPQILILDEPTNHLDVHYQIEVLELVRSLGITVIASIHDLNLAAAYCDRLLLLQQGQLIANGSPAEVLTPEMIKTVFQVNALVDCPSNSHRPQIRYQYQPWQTALEQEQP